MKFLLVDDDKLIRFSLKSMILDIVSSDCIITEAADGQEMINRCIEYEPDLIFVDIRMPNLDGLSAIKVCKEISPNSTFIVLSGYSDFDYARQCVSLGVTDYILKPIDLDSLQSIIRKAKKHLSDLHKQSNDLFQLYIHEIFHSPTHDISYLTHEQTLTREQLITHDQILPQGHILLSFALFIDCQNAQHNYASIHNELVSMLKQLGSHLLEKEILYSIDYSPEGHLYITFGSSKENETYLKNKLETICRSLLTERVLLYLFYTVQTDINNLFHQLEYIDENSYLRMDQKPATAINLSELSYSTGDLTFYEEISNLLDAFLNADEILYTSHLNTIYRYYQVKPAPTNLALLGKYIHCVTRLDVDTSDFKAFMKSFVTFSDSMYANLDCKSTEKIDQIIEYINHSYMNDISINQLASKYDLTPNYISKLFHEKTHTKFIDYLTNLRMTHAKKLLISNYDAPLKDIALMVGYYSPRHFSSTFKKLTNLLPSEYRKLHKADTWGEL